MKPKNCLIFGGSGQIGRHLIRKLTKNNLKVTVVTRNIHQKSYKIKTQANAGYLEIIESSIFDEAKNQSLLDRKIEQLKEFYTNSEIIISSSSSMAYETANKHSVKFSKRIDKYSNSTTPWPAVLNHILTNIHSPP